MEATVQLNLFDERDGDNPARSRRRHPTARAARYAVCLICRRDHRWYPTTLWQLPGNRRELYELTCDVCRHHYAGQIKRHRLDTDLALRLMLTTDCECCGQRIPVHHNRTQVIVDHDHQCCPISDASCGQCVRGFVCRPCNVELGWYERVDLARLRAYIARR